MPKGVSIGLFEAENLLWQIDRIHDRIDKALAETVALPIDTQARRHELVAGENFSVDVTFPDKPAAAAKWSVDKSSLEVPSGWAVTLQDKKSGTSSHFDVSIPAGAKLPSIIPATPFSRSRRRSSTLALRAEIEGYHFAIAPAGRLRRSHHHGHRHLPARPRSRRHAHRRAATSDGSVEARCRARRASFARALSRHEAR